MRARDLAHKIMLKTKLTGVDKHMIWAIRRKLEERVAKN